MHDYMKALYHRFESPSRRMEYMDRKIKRIHSQLARLLGNFDLSPKLHSVKIIQLVQINFVNW